MIRFDGNSILIADPDTSYGVQLSETLSFHGARCFRAEHISEAQELLKTYDFDVVISNYYLADGIIHQLINWSMNKLPLLPIFTCIGYPYSMDKSLSQRSAISEIFSKHDNQRILGSLSRLLFDFKQFQDNLLELTTTQGIMIEVFASGITQVARPLEISERGIYLQTDHAASMGTFGVLKFSILNGGLNQNFLIPGFFEEVSDEGQYFKINDKYLANWEKFLAFLNVKQLNITNFMKKVSGL